MEEKHDTATTIVLGVMAAGSLLFTTGRGMMPAFLWLSLLSWLLFSRRVRPVWALVTILAASSLTNLWVWSGVIPLPLPLYPIVGIVMGVFFSLPFFLERIIAPRSPAPTRILVFPALMTLSSHILTLISPSGSLVSIANSQSEFLIVQAASWFGVSGVVFLVSLLMKLVQELLDDPRSRKRNGTIAASLLLSLGLLSLPEGGATPPKTTLRVAGILHKAGETDPFERTELAIRRGAEVVLWQEALVEVTEEGEQDLIEKYQALSNRHQVLLGLTVYNTSRRNPAHKAENKLIFLQPGTAGPVEYLKAYPTPAEDIVRGSQTVRLTFRGLGISCALCFDMDFPDHVRKVVRQGVDVLLVPANDWKAVSALHAGIPRLRAVENGVNVFRVTGNGVSVAYDARGLKVFESDAFSRGEDFFLTDLPTRSRPTVYSQLGDVLPTWCAGFLAVVLTIGAGRLPAESRTNGSQFMQLP